MTEPKKCTHGGKDWPEFKPLPVPNEKTLKCGLCGALGYRRRRPGHHGAKRGKVKLYKCRTKDCAGVVVERKFGKGWQLINGCAEHPVR